MSFHITSLSYMESYSGLDYLEVKDDQGLLITIVGHSNIHTPYRMLNLSSILHVLGITKFVIGILLK